MHSQPLVICLWVSFRPSVHRNMCPYVNLPPELQEAHRAAEGHIWALQGLGGVLNASVALTGYDGLTDHCGLPCLISISLRF